MSTVFAVSFQCCSSISRSSGCMLCMSFRKIMWSSLHSFEFIYGTPHDQVKHQSGS